MSEFRYERSTVIAAPAERIIPHIEDLHAWVGWSPWEKMDPAMQRSYSGPEKGIGASYAWSSKKAGTGNITLNESTPSKLGFALNFIKPFKAENTCEFTFASVDGGTRVTWAMSGKRTLMSKAFGLFMDMDKLVGRDFEKGLASLKERVESER